MKRVRLKELGEISTGNTPVKSNAEYYDAKDIYFVKPDIFLDSGISFIDSTKEYLSEKAREKARIANKNDVFVTCIGSIGKVGIVHNDECAFNQQINSIMPNFKVLPQYLAYNILANKQKLQALANASVVPIINKTQFENFEIDIEENISVQTQIVEKLNKINAILVKEGQEIELLDNLVKARFVEMFGDPISNPMGWKETMVGDECYYIKDGPHKSLLDIGKENGGHPFISVRNIVNGYIDFSTAKYISDEDFQEAINKCHPEKGDILYSKGGTTGIAKLVDVDVKFANWVHVAVLKFDSSVLNGIFFENMLNCDYCYAQSQKLTKGIANRDLVLSAMAKIKIYKPPIKLQEQFAIFVNQTTKLKAAVQKSLDEAQMLFDSLMQQYFG